MVNRLGCDKNHVPMRVSNESWGHGIRLEDVWIDEQEGYTTWEPHVQAFKHADGSLSLRFCYYKRKEDGSRGKFANVAMFVYDEALEKLRDEAKKYKANVILSLFRELAE
jgi:hypothetical protein